MEECIISVRLNDIRRAGYGCRVGTETAVGRCCPHLCIERFLMVWEFLMRTAGHHWHWEHSNVCTASEKKTYRPSCFQWRLGVCKPRRQELLHLFHSAYIHCSILNVQNELSASLELLKTSPRAFKIATKPWESS